MNTQETEDAEDAELLETLEALSEVEQAPFTPRVVVRAFSDGELQVGAWTLFPLTFESWLRLEKCRSPYLIGEPPAEDAAQLLADLADAVSALSGESVKPEQIARHYKDDPTGAIDLVHGVQRVIRDAFETSIRMVPPRDLRSTSHTPEHGFGLWLVLYSRCIHELGMHLHDVFQFEVRQAIALLAVGMLRERYQVSGLTYQQRDIEEA